MMLTLIRSVICRGERALWLLAKSCRRKLWFVPVGRRFLTTPSCCQKATTTGKSLNSKFLKLRGSGMRHHVKNGSSSHHALMRAWFPCWTLTVMTAVIAVLHFAPVAFSQPGPFPKQQPQFDRISFDSGEPRGRCESPLLREVLYSHAIDLQDAQAGSGCETFVFRGGQADLENERITIPVKPSRVYPELQARLHVRGTFASIRLGVRVRFPHQKDPRTGELLAVDLFGETYSQVGKWQPLTCTTTADALSQRLLRTRDQLSTGLQPAVLDEREPYVDQVVILISLPAVRETVGAQALRIDELEFGPLVTPERIAPLRIESQQRSPSPLTFVDDRVRRDGKPFFPIFSLYHGESLDQITRSGVNMLWISDYTDRSLLTAIEQMGLGVLAAPPQPSPEQVITKQSTIAPLDDWTSPVWAWMLGFEIPADDLPYVAGWAKQVRDADRRQQRPLFADVAGREQDFHRSINFLSASQFGVHTSVQPREHFAQMRARRDASLPGKPMFSFVQTEPIDPILAAVDPRGPLPVVEPEQILHQAYASIAAGFKGVGFWKQIPFSVNGDGLDERIAAMQVFAEHGRILEPFLSTSKNTFEIPVLIDKPGSRGRAVPINPLTSRWDRAVQQASFEQAEKGPASEIRAACMLTDHGMVILPVWFEPNGQYVPGSQTAQNVRFLMRGVGEVAQAWEISPTGVSQTNLELTRTAGGTELSVARFDQSTVIVVSTDQSQIEGARQRARTYRMVAAEAFVSLAETKLKRVRAVHEELVLLNHAAASGESQLQLAERAAVTARQELLADHADEARLASLKCLAALRTLQRTCWEAAVASVGEPSASIDLCSFQTLPSHWRLINELSTRRFHDSNRLPGGNFESEEQLRSQWALDEDSNRSAILNLGPGGPVRGQILSLQLPAGQAGRPVALVSPEVELHKGELVLITGQLRIPQPLVGEGAEAMVFETLVGRAGAFSTSQAGPEWTTFRFVRRVRDDGALRLRIELRGAGAVQLDDIRVQVAPAVMAQ